MATSGFGRGGTALSTILTLPSGDEARPVRQAVAAIDMVHRVGALPPMHLVLRDLPPGEQGYYKPIAPLEIVIARQALRPAATTLHEIGHFLDHWALGLPGVFAAGAHRDLDAWIAAVAHSTAISELAALAVRTVSAGVKDLTDHLNYLLRPEELWARSYTQYIATRSGDRRLMAQVADARSRPTDPNVGYIPYQWDDLDFEPVAAAIDDLFRSYGWSN